MMPRDGEYIAMMMLRDDNTARWTILSDERCRAMKDALNIRSGLISRCVIRWTHKVRDLVLEFVEEVQSINGTTLTPTVLCVRALGTSLDCCLPRGGVLG
jgi:hypothetical protein